MLSTNLPRKITRENVLNLVHFYLTAIIGLTACILFTALLSQVFVDCLQLLRDNLGGLK